MKLTPIKYQEGWLYVDSEPIIGDLAYHKFQPYLFKITEANQGIAKDCKKIVAQRNLSLPNIPYVEDVEESIESLAHKVMMNYLTDGNPEGDFKHSTIGADENKNWWIAGYKAAQSKGGYSEADLRKAIEMARETVPNRLNHPEDGFESEYDEDEIIQSLNQPKEIEIEMEEIHGIDRWNTYPITYQKDGKTFLKVK